jgi:hypothetical protein
MVSGHTKTLLSLVHIVKVHLLWGVIEITTVPLLHKVLNLVSLCEFSDQACKNQITFNLSVKKYKHNAHSHNSQAAHLYETYDVFE